MRQTKSYIFILFSVLLLANCQPDIETVPIVNETKRRVVKAEDIPKVTSTLLGKLGLSNGTQRLLFSVLLLANCQPDIETVPIVNETKRRVVKAEDSRDLDNRKRR